MVRGGLPRKLTVSSLALGFDGDGLPWLLPPGPSFGCCHGNGKIPEMMGKSTLETPSCLMVLWFARSIFPSTNPEDAGNPWGSWGHRPQFLGTPGASPHQRRESLAHRRDACAWVGGRCHVVPRYGWMSTGKVLVGYGMLWLRSINHPTVLGESIINDQLMN